MYIHVVTGVGNDSIFLINSILFSFFEAGYAFVMKAKPSTSGRSRSLQVACRRAAPAVSTAACLLVLRGPLSLPPLPAALVCNAAATMTGIAAASFFSNACRFGGCGLHFDTLTELIAHIEDNHIGKLRHVTSAAASNGRALRLSGAAKLASKLLPAS